MVSRTKGSVRLKRQFLERELWSVSSGVATLGALLTTAAVLFDEGLDQQSIDDLSLSC